MYELKQWINQNDEKGLIYCGVWRPIRQECCLNRLYDYFLHNFGPPKTNHIPGQTLMQMVQINKPLLSFNDLNIGPDEPWPGGFDNQLFNDFSGNEIFKIICLDIQHNLYDTFESSCEY